MTAAAPFTRIADLLAIVAHVEAYIDFPEEDIDPETGADLLRRLDMAISTKCPMSSARPMNTAFPAATKILHRKMNRKKKKR